MSDSAVDLAETNRLAALYRLKVLDTPPEDRFDAITQKAKRYFHVPIVLISLVDAERVWFKSKQGFDYSESSRDVSLCAHALDEDELLYIPDTFEHPRYKDSPLVNAEPFIRFYCGAVLRDQESNKLGTICLIDREPRQLTDADFVILKELAQLTEKVLLSGNAQAEQA